MLISDTDYGSYTAWSYNGYNSYTRNGSFNKTDKLVFGEGISVDDLIFSKDNDNLVINISSGSDQITIENWYTHSRQRIEEIHFADGTILEHSQVHIIAQASQEDDLITAGFSRQYIISLWGR